MRELILFIFIGLLIGYCLIFIPVIGVIVGFAIIFGMLLKIIVQLSRVPKYSDPVTKNERRISKLTESEYNKFYKGDK
ncbi:hypothetical protein [Chengkuizengella axinellae]|uniref:Uncharacterized protein n=1 Tax=Chengkuizengella axinellae TaxID=3064388 RepID=A0ABT9IV41_9BACL|nr:hypothetical protein [Chengkuizengella sp. 2205SS18-9]MDP5272927.1 hypothetical protein [Chengkuizengella sp. 2205SS18-9]